MPSSSKGHLFFLIFLREHFAGCIIAFFLLAERFCASFDEFYANQAACLG